MVSRRLVSLFGVASLVGMITLAARATGFLRWFAQSSFVGAEQVANAYSSANQLPNVVFEVVVGGALAGVTVPLLAAPITHHLRQQVDQISSALLTWTLAILMPLALLVWAGADQIVSWLPVSAGSDAQAQNELAATFLKIFAWQIPLYGVSVVLTGILQAHRRFIWPALAPLLSSLVVITAYGLYGSLSGGVDSPTHTPTVAIEVLGWGTTAGVGAMSLPLFIPVYLAGVRLHPTWRLEKPIAKRIFALALAGVGGLLAQQLAVLTNLFLARWGGELGTVAVFQYTQAVYVLPYAVLAVPVGITVFPRLTELAAEGDREGFTATCAKSLRSVMAVSLFGAGALIALGPAAQAIFAWRNPMEGMALALVCLAPSLPGYALLFLGSRAMYALQAPRAAGLATSLGWGLTALAAALSVRMLAAQGGDGPATLQGLAIGQSVGMSVGAAFLLVALVRLVGREAVSGLGRVTAVMTPAALLAGFGGRWAYEAVLDLLGESLWVVGGAALTSGIIVLVVNLTVVSALLRGKVSLRRAHRFHYFHYRRATAPAQKDESCES